MKILEAQSISKRYQMGSVLVEALREVDLVIEKGEFVAIMGPSGSGKSTLLHLLGGLDKPSSGEILLAGQPLSRLSDDQITVLRRRKIGFIFQFYNLQPTLNAVENVALPLLIDGQPLRKHRERIEDLLGLVDLTEREEHRPEQLSGGQQQRVAIARALVNQPEIILADEPTGNLDSRAGASILELLRRSCSEMGATIVMVTHDARAASYASRVIFLKDGMIVRTLQGKEEEGVSMQEIMAQIALLEESGEASQDATEGGLN